MSSRKQSWVWGFFTKSQSGKEVTCSICNAVLCYNNSTSALNNHLKFVHRKDRNDGKENTNLTNLELSSTESQSQNEVGGRKRKRRLDDDCNCTLERQETISRAVARLIATNMLPISLVSSDGFREFMAVLEPGYKVPCEQKNHSRLQLLFNDVKKVVSKELSEAVSTAISVDEWSSRTQDCYISVEAQYFDKNNELSSVTLCNEQLEGRPNAKNIASAVEVVLDNWNISDKVQAITHDSASVMNAAAHQLFNIKDSIKCAAHLLQLVIKDAIATVPQYEEICKKGKHLAGFFHRSHLGKHALSTRQVQLGIKGNRLVQSCETRWNSKLYMCESLLLNRNAICLVLADRSVIKSCDALNLEISEKEWTEMGNMVTVLKPFDKATSVLCGRSVTLSMVRPLVHRLIHHHMSASPDEEENEKTFKESARNSLYRRFNIDTITDEVSASTISEFFDPRYKNLNGENIETKSKVQAFIKSSLQKINVSNEEVANTMVTDMDFLFNSENTTNDVLTQFDLYLAEPQIGHNINPITWWKHRCGIYPDIFNLAKRYLCIPATSAESERTFSIAGNIVTPRRSCLSPQNVQLLTFLYQNRRFMKDFIPQ